MTSAELSITLDLALLVTVALLFWLGPRFPRIWSRLRIDLVPWLSAQSINPETGAPIRSWKGATYSALAIFLALNAVALVALALAWLGVWSLGTEVATVFAVFGVLVPLAIFLQQCPANILKK